MSPLLPLLLAGKETKFFSGVVAAMICTLGQNSGKSQLWDNPMNYCITGHFSQEFVDAEEKDKIVLHNNEVKECLEL